MNQASETVKRGNEREKVTLDTKKPKSLPPPLKGTLSNRNGICSLNTAVRMLQSTVTTLDIIPKTNADSCKETLTVVGELNEGKHFNLKSFMDKHWPGKSDKEQDATEILRSLLEGLLFNKSLIRKTTRCATAGCRKIIKDEGESIEAILPLTASTSPTGLSKMLENFQREEVLDILYNSDPTEIAGRCKVCKDNFL